MRTDLDHLPANKQRELERVVQIVFEEFDDAFALAKHEWKKAGRILKIVLYGSYARGGWIDEPHTAKGYKSDFDLLIVVNDKRLTDRVKPQAEAMPMALRDSRITRGGSPRKRTALAGSPSGGAGRSSMLSSVMPAPCGLRRSAPGPDPCVRRGGVRPGRTAGRQSCSGRRRDS